jgi:predicted nucleic acid-binding protein
MIYFDTSFLAPLVILEPTSAAIEPFMAKLPSQDLSISQWTQVEFSSVVARRVRMRELEPWAAVKAEAQFDAIIRESFTVILPAASDFDLARTYLAVIETGLRAGDALHLAIASARGAEAIYSLDRALPKAGKILGLPVSQGIDLRA